MPQVRDYPIVFLLLVFFAISIAGWIFEFCYCSVKEHRFVNRGFLNGPYCPIYGTGAVVGLLLFGDVSNPAALFLSGAMSCTVLEYATSWAMEKMFHARWWDYSERRFNLNGRVCLAGFCLFGAGIVALLEVVAPLMEDVYACFDAATWVLASVLLCLLMLVDVVVTSLGLCAFRDKVDRLFDGMTECASRLSSSAEAAMPDKLVGALRHMRDGLPGKVRLSWALEAMGRASQKLPSLNWQEKRILSAFPHIRFTRERGRRPDGQDSSEACDTHGKSANVPEES